ncbi:MAG: aminopeptidase P family protein [Ruminococcaceae bacterium]|nr:aminopeptidase P family protein [Oscillospiraceae bacterium]
MTVYDMQNLNRETVNYISNILQPGMSLREIRTLCEEYMLAYGADSFWYWDVGAFVFRGTDTILSVSGKQYETANTVIEPNDIITIDLSPQHNRVWGDYARTIILEDGLPILEPAKVKNYQWRDGLLMEERLHEAMLNFVCPDTTFEDLFFYINDVIKAKGYVNLDFLGNLGHSIVSDKSLRIYIEKGNKTKLTEVEAFTFEPHISLSGGKYGYKKENIYAFAGDRLIEL